MSEPNDSGATPATGSEPILLERDGHVAVVTLNRPDKLNAMNLPAWERLAEIFAELDADDDVWCILLRAAGDRAFGAGSDISEFPAVRADREQAREYGRALHGSLEALAGCRHPMVAAIEGLCVGGGLEIACACDLRICGASSRFGVPVNRLGLTMAYEELRHLLAVVDPPAALEILLEGSIFDAERALQIGLVSRVVADDRVADEARATVDRICAGAPLVNRWHKRFIRRLQDPTPPSAEEIDEGYACFDTEDYREGVRAFLDKDEPDFRGR